MMDGINHVIVDFAVQYEDLSFGSLRNLFLLPTIKNILIIGCGSQTLLEF